MSDQPASEAGSSGQVAAARLDVKASTLSAQTMSRSQHGESSAFKKESSTESEYQRPTTAAELKALLPNMKLYDAPAHLGRHFAPPLLNPEEVWVDGEHDEDDFDYGDIGDYEDDDDDYDSLLYSTEDEGELDYESSIDSDPEVEVKRQKMRAEANAQLDAKRTPEEIELDLKIKRVAEARRAGRAAIKEWKPLPSACLGCFKIGSTADGTLMQCSRCKVIKYCSGACQKAHWPKHKESCKKYAVDTSSPDKYPFHAIYQSTFLHNRDETKTYQLLIDCLRMRQEDVYTLGGDTMAGTIYNQEPSSIRAFKQFLRKAKWVPHFFPPWWTEEKEKACIEYGMNDSHFSLKCAQEKSDIQKTWKDPQMPMKLRMIAESVYGDTPGGSRSEHVMEMMMQTERGKFTATTLDVSGGKKKK